MIKTFLRRWYVTNRLYHFRRRRKDQSTHEELDFVFWVLGGDLMQIMDPTEQFEVSRIISWLFEEKDTNKIFSRVQETIEECTDPEVGLIFRQVGHGSFSSDHLKLTTRGKETYSVSYILGNKILGNAYVKTAIIGFVGTWFTLWANSVIRGSVQTTQNYKQDYGLQVEEFRRWIPPNSK